MIQEIKVISRSKVNTWVFKFSSCKSGSILLSPWYVCLSVKSRPGKSKFWDSIRIFCTPAIFWRYFILWDLGNTIFRDENFLLIKGFPVFRPKMSILNCTLSKNVHFVPKYQIYLYFRGVVGDALFYEYFILFWLRLFSGLNFAIIHFCDFLQKGIFQYFMVFWSKLIMYIAAMNFCYVT